MKKLINKIIFVTLFFVGVLGLSSSTAQDVLPKQIEISESKKVDEKNNVFTVKYSLVKNKLQAKYNLL